jgi:hypothetical protein
MRQLSFFPLPASRERTGRPPVRPALTYGATIRLADLGVQELSSNFFTLSNITINHC